ncbi:hypothetical protein FF38_05297 [Lucilia cuprina]|uniref:Uncharacterized protein n=1 Tax=Lucilia cuprina TaxID=7375 RepID=A0A0L0CLA3_LUCCU|nr:hypothetical protein FF38_05297 [Lucilia cuprina]
MQTIYLHYFLVFCGNACGFTFSKKAKNFHTKETENIAQHVTSNLFAYQVVLCLIVDNTDLGVSTFILCQENVCTYHRTHVYTLEEIFFACVCLLVFPKELEISMLFIPFIHTAGLFSQQQQVSKRQQQMKIKSLSFNISCCLGIKVFAFTNTF